MLGWTFTFFVIALFAALYGFGGVTGALAGIGQMVFIAAVVLCLVSVLTDGFKGRVYH